MSIILTAACFTAMWGQEVETWVGSLLEQYPKARLLDIYKSSFQDYMGAEHLVGDTASVRGYLEQELATTDIDDLQPWYYEPCGGGGRYVRVSLRAVIEGLYRQRQRHRAPGSGRLGGPLAGHPGRD